ncbi:MAG: META domain-containing protein [Coriobacteriia bacterium]
MIGPLKRLAALLLIAASLTAVTGCSLAADPLDGTQWRLSGWTISSIDPAAVTITAAFADGQVSGGSGVNTYSGSYKAGPGGAFETGKISGTLMAGPEPAMRAESAYLTLIRQARSFEVADGELTLLDEGGNVSLVFKTAGE